jgi:hypothetical protein
VVVCAQEDDVAIHEVLCGAAKNDIRINGSHTDSWLDSTHVAGDQVDLRGGPEPALHQSPSTSIGAVHARDIRRRKDVVVDDDNVSHPQPSNLLRCRGTRSANADHRDPGSCHTRLPFRTEGSYLSVVGLGLEHQLRPAVGARESADYAAYDVHFIEGQEPLLIP